jgi:GNAT superfamily N-acetyltransferase
MRSLRFDATRSWLSPRNTAAWRPSDGPPRHMLTVRPGRLLPIVSGSRSSARRSLAEVEVAGATIESLYVSPAAARLGVGSALLTHAERHIRDAGAFIAHLEASPNAEAFYARRGYSRAGEVKANNAIPMSKRLDLSPV